MGSHETTWFFTPPERIAGDRIALLDEEAHHAVRVLRRRPGDELIVVDGEGGWYRMRLDRADRKGVEGRILERRHEVGEPGYRLTVGIGLLRQPARFETFLEKAVELGVSAVVPLLTERTEKVRFNEGRARRILTAAMKQCGRSRLVDLQPSRPLQAWLTERPPGVRLICHEQADPTATVMTRLAGASDEDRITVLIGPEGGFAADEVARAASAGYQVVSLGPRRLRAETAGIVAATAVMLARAGAGAVQGIGREAS
ncbi:MAG: ribosomal RNA small subunit methyltransferase E [Rhodothermaceae bacterium]|nr:MAG: ribosomal RNA small subunit methyltransferase E [Rhodothermaceae bacterium]